MAVALSDLLLTLPLDQADVALLEVRAGAAAGLAKGRRVRSYLVLGGALQLCMASHTIELQSGDFVMLRRDVSHTLKSLGDTVRKAERLSISSPSDGVPRIAMGAGSTNALLLCAEIGVERDDARAVGAGLPNFIKLERANLVLPVPSYQTRQYDLAALIERSGGRALAVSLIHLLYVHAVQGIYNESTSSKPPGARLQARHSGVEAALRMLHHEPGANWTVASLATIAGMSRSAFARAFQISMGTTPMAHVTGVRLDRARQLLRQEEPRHIAEVAYTSGYRSHAAFSRAYRQKFGVSPSTIAADSAVSRSGTR